MVESRVLGLVKHVQLCVLALGLPWVAYADDCLQTEFAVASSVPYTWTGPGFSFPPFSATYPLTRNATAELGFESPTPGVTSTSWLVTKLAIGVDYTAEGTFWQAGDAWMETLPDHRLTAVNGSSYGPNVGVTDSILNTFDDGTWTVSGKPIVYDGPGLYGGDGATRTVASGTYLGTRDRPTEFTITEVYYLSQLENGGASGAPLVLQPLTPCPTEPPQSLELTHQGRLSGISGVPMNGTIPAIFTLYADTTPGEPDWALSTSIVVTDGYYSIRLGVDDMGRTLDQVLFAAEGDVWLGVTVDGVEITPRSHLAFVPSAAVARSVSTVPGGTSISAEGQLVVGTLAASTCDTVGQLIYDVSAEALKVCNGTTFDWVGPGDRP